MGVGRPRDEWVRRLVLPAALPRGQKPVVRKSVRWGEWTGESCSVSSICGGEALLL